MGCTYDIVTVTMKEKEHLETFIEMFNEILKEEWDEDYEIFADEIEEYEGMFQIQVDEEPMFSVYEEGYQIDHVVEEFLKKVPNAECLVEYDCTFNNCGDALCVEWEYKNNKFIVTRWYGDNDAIHYCPKCDADFDEPLCFLKDYDPNTDYICPECGEKLKMDVTKIINEMILVNGEWEVLEESNIDEM